MPALYSSHRLRLIESSAAARGRSREDKFALAGTDSGEDAMTPIWHYGVASASRKYIVQSIYGHERAAHFRGARVRQRPLADQRAAPISRRCYRTETIWTTGDAAARRARFVSMSPQRPLKSIAPVCQLARRADVNWISGRAIDGRTRRPDGGVGVPVAMTAGDGPASLTQATGHRHGHRWWDAVTDAGDGPLWLTQATGHHHWHRRRATVTDAGDGLPSLTQATGQSLMQATGCRHWRRRRAAIYRVIHTVLLYCCWLADIFSFLLLPIHDINLYPRFLTMAWQFNTQALRQLRITDCDIYTQTSRMQ